MNRIKLASNSTGYFMPFTDEIFFFFESESSERKMVEFNRRISCWQMPIPEIGNVSICRRGVTHSCLEVICIPFSMRRRTWLGRIQTPELFTLHIHIWNTFENYILVISGCCGKVAWVPNRKLPQWVGKRQRPSSSKRTMPVQKGTKKVMKTKYFFINIRIALTNRNRFSNSSTESPVR